MCDPECRKRFVVMEVQLASIATDIKWFKWLVRSITVGIAAFLGADLTGMM